MNDVFPTLISFAVSGFVVFLLAWGVLRLNEYLIQRYANDPAREYQRQLAMLGASLVALVFAILVIPIGDTMRGQVLSLLGILLSATIALSSTTLVGNIVAGFMLKAVKSLKPGVYIRVGEHAGRISAMDLIHTEIQTEDRDLETLPNLFLATNPVRVLRVSGTILSAEVSLGYDLSRRRVEALLIQAAEKTGLESPFVQIRELGDFSIVYRIAGLATQTDRFMSTRRQLRAAVLDSLHAGGVEIVSPSYMNTRPLSPDVKVMPPQEQIIETDVETHGPGPDDVVFDKAQQAESVERLRESRSEIVARIEACEAILKEFKEGDESPECQAALRDLESLQKKQERLDKVIAAAQVKIASE